MEIRQLGKLIQMGNVIFPACNIQVEDIPEGFDIYFEIMWENGNNWTVYKDNDNIVVEICIDFANADYSEVADCYMMLNTWDEFVAEFITERGKR
jgi:hypothetical protein